MTGQETARNDFTLLIHSFALQASAALGLSPLPGSEAPPKIDLPLAQHLIDILAMLQTKTAGNLTPEEESNLSSILGQLRMAYVEVSAHKPTTGSCGCGCSEGHGDPETSGPPEAPEGSEGSS